MLDLAIIGAGPYGLSLAAHAKKAGLQYKVFGYPMDFWKSKMPPNMFIRTLLEYTGLSDPDNKFTLKKYEIEKNLELAYPIPRSIFVDYGLWFIEQTNISIDKAYVTNVTHNNGLFDLQTENGDSFRVKNAIIAVGLTNAQYIPSDLALFEKDLVSHTANYTSFERFENQHVLVVGGGQSAWEAAALLHKANAKVDLVYRRPQRLSPDKNLNKKQQELAGKFYYFSKQEKEQIRGQFEKPTVSDFLVPLVEGKVTQRSNTFISRVSKTNDNKLHVIFNDQTSLIVDHVIAATGYRFSPNKLSFLQSNVQNIEMNELGGPVVNEYFESSISNLFFAGPAIASSHGPTYRFIAGVWQTSEVLIDYIRKKVFR